MKVSEYLKKDFCIMDLKATEKVGAISEIATCLFDSGQVDDAKKLATDISEREILGSTGIGHGIAIPHARTTAVKNFVIGFGKSKVGIDFKSIDEQPAHLIFLMGADPKDLNLYLRLLAELSKLLMNSAFRTALLSAVTGEDIISSIKQFEK